MILAVVALLWAPAGGSVLHAAPDIIAERSRPLPAAVPLLPAALVLGLLGGGLLVWRRGNRPPGSKRAGSGVKDIPGASAEMCRMLFEQTSDAVILHDSDFHILATNGAAEQMLGYSDLELQQMQIQDLFDPDYIQRKPLRIDQILDGTHDFSDRTIIRKDGQAVIVRVKVRLAGEGRFLALLRDITEVHNVRRSEPNEALLRNSIDNSASGICIVSLDGKFLNVNPALCSLTGYSAAELTALHFQDISHPDDLERDMEFIRNARAGTENIFQGEKRYYRKDGSLIWVRLNVATIRDETGEALHFFAQVDDITETREANNNYRLLVEQSLAGVYIYQDGRFAYANPRLAAIFGYTQQELMDLPAGHEIIDAQDRGLVQEQIRLRESGERKTVRYEVRGVKKNGEVIWTEIFGATTYFLGKPAFIGTMQDITERKGTEASILHEKNLLESVVKSLPGIFYITEPDGRLIRWNEQLEQVSGYSSEELQGKYTMDLAEPVERERILNARAEALRSGKVTGEVRIVTKQGEIRTYYICVMPITYNGQLRILGIGLDFSDKKKAEAGLLAKTAEAEARSAELQAFFEGVEGAASLLDTKKQFLIFNRHFSEGYKRVTGREPEVGSNAFDFFPPDRIAEFDQLLGHVMCGNQEIIEEAYEIDGTLLHFRTSFTPVMSASGTVTGVALYSIDQSGSIEAERQLQRINRELNERVKELRCLYRVSQVVNDGDGGIEDMMRKLAGIISFGWQYPDVACVKLMYADQQFCSANFRESPWSLEAPIVSNERVVGTIAVYYLEETPPAADGPFLQDERALLDLITGMVGGAIERKRSAAELEKLSRLYQFTSAFNEAMLRATDEQSIYTEACGIAVRLGNYRTAWIGVVDAAGARIRPQALAGHDDGSIGQIDIDLNDPGLNQGVTGLAIYTRSVQYSDDIAADPRMTRWRDLALAQDFRASIALPILISDKLIGLFVLYRSEPFSFNETEISLLQRMTGNIAYAVDNLRSRDATRRYLEKLSESEEQFRSLAEETPVGVYILQDGKFCYVNPQFEQITGYRKQELLQDFPFDRLIHADDLKSAQKAYLARIEDKSTDGQSIFRGIHADGSLRYIDLITSHIRYQGKPAMIGTVIDITEQVEEEKRFNLAITEAQEAERLAIGMELHDNIKQIIATSLINLYLVRENLDHRERALEFLTEARHQIRQAIAELRKISHQLAPSVDMSIPFESKVASLISGMNISGQVQVQYQLEFDAAQMSSSVQLAFYRIIQEQFANILKYADATQVTISIVSEGEQLRLTLSDNGRGFEPESKKSGIGLENIRRRAKALNGDMALESAPGAGCRLSVQVPAAL